MNSPYYILGLDPGIASCGFCLIDTNNHRIVEMGSHLFPIPQNPKDKVSLAKKRRGYRSSRRNNQRKKNRLNKTLDLLKDYGLIPQDATKNDLQSAKGDKPIRELRVKGLDDVLTDREFAQILYSLAGRRGYISHGAGSFNDLDSVENTGDAENGKVLKSVKENTKALKEGNYRTVGEYLASTPRSRNRGGDYEMCVLHIQLIDEVKNIFSAQRACGNSKASEDMEEKYLAIFSWEKKSVQQDERVYSQVGSCTYFSEETRAANASLSSEMCRAYERLGHLVIVQNGNTEKRLTSEQTAYVMNILFSPEPIKGNKYCKVTYGHLRKKFVLSAHDYFKGISVDKEKTTEIFTPHAFRKMRSVIYESNRGFMSRLLDDLDFADAVMEALTYASSEESLEVRLGVLGVELSKDDMQLLKNVPFASKNFKGYGNRSKKALDLLLDAFKEDEVFTLFDAEKSTGLYDYRIDDSQHTKTNFLPPYSVYDPVMKNPVVLRSISRMRKIVNSIIRLYGVPHEIHIELGRELSHSKNEKKRISKARDANEAANKEAASLAASLLGIEEAEVTGKVIQKIKLYEEQDQKDLYTGKDIDFEQLVKDDFYCQIDHVLPYSRTGIDAMKNKVLCLTSSNANKKERTPYEWMNSGEEKSPDWNVFKARVQNSSKIKNNKKKFLLRESLTPEDQDGFLERNLNDTRYMARVFKDYLRHCLVFPEGRYKESVLAVNGATTGMLRRVWGLNFGAHGVKDRKDDRHHAVDAAVIAACSVSAVQNVARNRYSIKRDKESRLASTQPWLSFADDVIAYRETIIPTRMVDHGVTGSVFDEFFYSFCEKDKQREDKKICTSKTTRKYDKNGKYTEKKRQDVSGNYRLHDNGKTVQKIGGMAYLQLWHDPHARHGKGKWYADPVFYADIPQVKTGNYKSTIAKAGLARNYWEEIPEHVLMQNPIVIFRDDVVEINGLRARYSGFNIATAYISWNDLLTGEATKIMPSLGKWDNATKVCVIQEDCLGYCYKEYKVDSEE